MHRLLLAVVASSIACAPSLESYDRSCNVDADCALVLASDSCDCRCGGNFAINQSEVERFDREQEPFCPLPTTVDCLCTLPPPVVCIDATCEIAL